MKDRSHGIAKAPRNLPAKYRLGTVEQQQDHQELLVVPVPGISTEALGFRYLPVFPIQVRYKGEVGQTPPFHPVYPHAQLPLCLERLLELCEPVSGAYPLLQMRGDAA